MQSLHEADFGGAPILPRQQCDSSRCKGKLSHIQPPKLLMSVMLFSCKLQLCKDICTACLTIKVTGVATSDVRAALHASYSRTVFSLGSWTPSVFFFFFLPTSMSRLAAPLRVLIVRLMSTIDSKRISHLTQATNTNRADGADLKQAADPYTSLWQQSPKGINSALFPVLNEELAVGVWVCVC